MTDLTKPVTRRVTTRTGAVLAVTLAPEGIYFREPRRRHQSLIEYGLAWTVAEKLAAEKTRAD